MAMNEFELIDRFFKTICVHRDDVVFGIGDDAACLTVPSGKQLIVTTDTQVADRHFLTSWDAYDIAYKAVMVNISDIAAMAAEPAWLSLSLTLPEANESWLTRFGQGLADALKPYNIALIGGDTTRGPLSITITLQGLIPKGQSVRRKGANPGDIIYVTGELGAAAQAVELLDKQCLKPSHNETLMAKLQHPRPRVDMQTILRQFATAAIDISDGLSADLNHICEMSKVGACLIMDNIPIHPLVEIYQADNALEFAIQGGDDYELCFTVAPEKEKQLLKALSDAELTCYSIGQIETNSGLRAQMTDGRIESLSIGGYRHF